MNTILSSRNQLLELSDLIGAMARRIQLPTNRNSQLTADVAALNLRWGNFLSEHAHREKSEGNTVTIGLNAEPTSDTPCAPCPL